MAAFASQAVAANAGVAHAGAPASAPSAATDTGFAGLLAALIGLPSQPASAPLPSSAPATSNAAPSTPPGANNQTAAALPGSPAQSALAASLQNGLLPNGVPTYAQSLGLAFAANPFARTNSSVPGQTIPAAAAQPNAAVAHPVSPAAPAAPQSAAGWLQQMTSGTASPIGTTVQPASRQIPLPTAASATAAPGIASALQQLMATSGLTAPSPAPSGVSPPIQTPTTAPNFPPAHVQAPTSVPASFASAPGVPQVILAAHNPQSLAALFNIPQASGATIQTAPPANAHMPNVQAPNIPAPNIPAANIPAASTPPALPAANATTAAPLSNMLQQLVNTGTAVSVTHTPSAAPVFTVPQFPASMAYAPPAAHAEAAAPVTPPAGVPSISSLLQQIANGMPPTAAATASASPAVVPALAAPASSVATPASAGIANAPAAAQATNLKAANLAEAAIENFIRQGSAAPVTEAQSLPVRFNLAAAKPASGTPVVPHADDKSNTLDDGVKPATSDPAAPTSTTGQHASADPQAAPAQTAPAAPATSANAPSAPLPGAANAVPANANPATAPAQAAAAPPANTAPAVAQPDVNTLALNIAAKSAGGARQFDIRLDPAELGRVEVRLSLDATGTAQAHLAADRPETLALLQNNAATLTRALQDSGVQVANNGLQFSLRGQERDGDGGGQHAPARHRANAVQAIAAANVASSMSSSYALSPAGGGVNILV